MQISVLQCVLVKYFYFLFLNGVKEEISQYIALLTVSQYITRQYTALVGGVTKKSNFYDINSTLLLKKFGISKIFIKEINTFIQQGCIFLIKRVSITL